MKKVGILGGMGPESTIPYYHDILYGVHNRLGKNCFPKLTIESVDVFKVLSLCKLEQYKELVAYLMEAINNLCKCNVDFIILAANTPHIVYDQLVEKTSVPIISIVKETAKYAEKHNLKKLGLIGTAFTMNGEFFRKPFAERKIEIVIPSKEDACYVSQKISSELELGIIKEETKTRFCQIISRMKEEDEIEGIILGCTEVPLIIDNTCSPVMCLDTMQIHIQAVVDRIVESDQRRH